MQFSGEGYIIKVQNHGEKSAIVTLVCPEYGKVVGFVESARSKKNLGIYQIGNYISFNAYARVAENMLSLKGVELVHSYVPVFLADTDKIEALSSMCQLLNVCVAESDDLGKLYETVDDFFTHIQLDNWLVYYSFFEFYLLEFLGIGLDVNECAVTGKHHDLSYISPKTGRAVCAQVGEPYKDRLYGYPHYIIDRNYQPPSQEIANVLTMTGAFLNKNFLRQHNLQLPENRGNLLKVFKL